MKRPVCGLILHSPIMSGIRVLMENRGPLCCCDIYPNINRIKRVTCPVLVIHGDRDIEVGFNHGVGMQEAVPKHSKTEPCWIEGGGHNNIVDEFPHEYYPKVQAFLNSLKNTRDTMNTNASASSSNTAEKEMVLSSS
uniref:Serine hydrolase FSH domain-containing protein n=1 Tax=Aplanochytrium stocchinoi TaxID=215587 RepID=A0A7S3PLF3_9STRA